MSIMYIVYTQATGRITGVYKAVARSVPHAAVSDGEEILERIRSGEVLFYRGGEVVSGDKPVPDHHEEWSRIRLVRDRMLEEADVQRYKLLDRQILGEDVTADLVACATYCQALRDLPETFATPAEVVWPEKPMV